MILNSIEDLVSIISNDCYLSSLLKSGVIRDYKFNGIDEDGVHQYSVLCLSAVKEFKITLSAGSDVKIKND